MTTAKKVRGNAVPMALGILIGVLASLLLTAGLAVLLTWLELNGKIAPKTIGFYVMGVLFIASDVGCWMATIKIQRRWMLVCSVTGAMYYMALLASTALFFGGNYRGTAVSAVAILLGSVAPAAVGLSVARRGGKSYRKYRSC